MEENSMKKSILLKVLMIAGIIAILALAITACDINNGGEITDTTAPSDIETDAKCEQHIPGEWITDTEPTCASAGSKHVECTVCGTVIETAEIAALAHTEEIVEGVAPTCSAEGLTQGKKCSACGTTLLAQESIAKLPHTESILTELSATCTTDGHGQGKICSVCNEIIVEPEVIPAIGHIESDWIIDTPAAVGIEGAKHKECTVCGTELAKDSISAIEESHVHSGSTWTVTKPANCISAGEKALVCECGYTVETQVIEKTNVHTEITILGKAATCIEQGLTDGKKCSVCGVVTVKQTPTAYSSHIEEPVLGTGATCTEGGTTDGKKCSVCGVTTVTQLPTAPKGHNFEGGVCTVCGFKGNYGLWITDGLGMPMTDIIVNIKKDGETVKTVRYNGQYSTFDLEDGNYTVELDLSMLKDTNYVYDVSEAVLSPEKKSLSLKIYRTTVGEELLYVSSPIDADYNSTFIGTGSYKVSLTAGDYTFFVFAPETPAIYTMTYECDDALIISYHGATFFTQGRDLSEDADGFKKYGNGLAFDVYSSNIGASYVFAVKSTTATECVLNIQNAGDPGTRLEDQPWVSYTEDEKLVESMKKYPQEGEYTVIDLGDTSVSAVLNPDDGFYHLNSVDGPVIFIDFTSETSYVASLFTICAHQRIGEYIYDSNGNVVEKRSYNELLIQCGMPDPMTEGSAEPGVRVPLTEKLAEAVKSFGEKQGWWEEGADSNIFNRVFNGVPYNQEYAWLLYCGYYK